MQLHLCYFAHSHRHSCYVIAMKCVPLPPTFALWRGHARSPPVCCRARDARWLPEARRRGGAGFEANGSFDLAEGAAANVDRFLFQPMLPSGLVRTRESAL